MVRALLMLGGGKMKFNVVVASQLLNGDSEETAKPDPEILAEFLDRVLEHLLAHGVVDADYEATLARGTFVIAFELPADTEGAAREEADRLVVEAFEKAAWFPLYWPAEARTVTATLVPA
jgi:hypothetical protein